MTEPWDSQMQALGDFIRRQRKLANLSLRQLAERTRLSNPYLSQIERGLHQPSMRVIKRISEALNVSVESLLSQAGLFHSARSDDWAADPGNEAGEASEAGVGRRRRAPDPVSVERAINADGRLSEQQKSALINVYRSMLPADQNG
jgi:transcriptional regulator with XRE-family HTH domain